MGSLRERCARVFKVCDEDNKGYLNREDLEVAVVMLFGYKPSEVEVDSIMSSVRPENSDKGFLTFEDFKKTFNSVLPKLSERIIIEAFSHGPPVLACARHLIVPCCALLLCVLCVILEGLCCEAREVDQDSDGRISFKEFECAMKHGQDEVSPLYFA
ncbi:EF-hand calcium-binding domain-containing protein 11 isoform X3 [Numida meleagris]|uniref:EF-hand calcium-binding domain-containing protein 11 isoform X3 n=1 Tax=Numida meleagris TaxID=8996 RepID=UPI000B3E1A7B|nr:EF-hand calcium-binding domain-containing protein 11 isoform X3 [Numida meleagris]